ncbi:MAG: hypothetical protein JWO44_698 [Bacteroidetes bacterium]|nr:hypothetical protein [Bacteroidota bacterium]
MASERPNIYRNYSPKPIPIAPGKTIIYGLRETRHFKTGQKLVLLSYNKKHNGLREAKHL